MTSVLDHERSKTTDDQGYRISNVVNLKNPKSRKINNNHSVSDILDGDEPPHSYMSGGGEPIELEAEPLPIGPVKKSEGNSKKESDFLETLPGVDRVVEFPNAALPQEDPEGNRKFHYPVDNEGVIPNNAGNMAPLATLTHAPLGAARARSVISPLMGSLVWTAPDKNHELISHALRKWMIVILVAVAFLAFFWQDSILSAITFFALALVTSMHFWREAVHHKYEIHSHGIAIGDRFYHYHDLDSFWIHYHPEGHHELSLCTGNLIDHYVKVPLGDRDPFEVRDALMMYLPEERHEEGLEDLLRRKLGL